MNSCSQLRFTQIIFWLSTCLLACFCAEVTQDNFVHLLQDRHNYRPKVGIVMMIHDDEDLLHYWLRYHSAIVGVENIVVLDQNSRSEMTQITLRAWHEMKDLKVLWNQGPYSAKGELTYDAFQRYLSDIDIALPLDSDEFLVAFNGSHPIFSKKAIIDELRNFWESKAECWGFQQYYTSLQLSLNDSVKSVRHFHPAIYALQNSKKMIRWDILRALDHGSHSPTLSQGGCDTALDHLGLFHYHFRSPKITVERALNDALGFGYLPSNVTFATLKDHRSRLEELLKKGVPGNHKIRQLVTYLDKGLPGLLHNVPVESALALFTVDEIVFMIENDSLLNI